MKKYEKTFLLEKRIIGYIELEEKRRGIDDTTLFQDMLNSYVDWRMKVEVKNYTKTLEGKIC